jgi:hypothetical protein
LKQNYFDKNGKNSISDPTQLKEYIVNIYKTIMLRGIKGTYVYVCDKNLRDYLGQHIPRYKTDPGINYVSSGEVVPFENAIPVYDLKAAAGHFSDLQIVSDNIHDFDWIQLPRGYRYSSDLFACTVKGESMNKVIPNGSVCLFRKYFGGSRNGKIVLVEQTSIQDPDFGSGYTVKEYCSIKEMSEGQWRHHSIILKPLSSDPNYKDIVLSDDNMNSLTVIGVFECVLVSYHD